VGNGRGFGGFVALARVLYGEDEVVREEEETQTWAYLLVKNEQGRVGLPRGRKTYFPLVACTNVHRPRRDQLGPQPIIAMER
jgi:hypothetical protein